MYNNDCTRFRENAGIIDFFATAYMPQFILREVHALFTSDAPPGRNTGLLRHMDHDPIAAKFSWPLDERKNSGTVKNENESALGPDPIHGRPTKRPRVEDNPAATNTSECGLPNVDNRKRKVPLVGDIDVIPGRFASPLPSPPASTLTNTHEVTAPTDPGAGTSAQHANPGKNKSGKWTRVRGTVKEYDATDEYFNSKNFTNIKKKTAEKLEKEIKEPLFKYHKINDPELGLQSLNDGNFMKEWKIRGTTETQRNARTHQERPFLRRYFHPPVNSGLEPSVPQGKSRDIKLEGCREYGYTSFKAAFEAIVKQKEGSGGQPEAGNPPADDQEQDEDMEDNGGEDDVDSVDGF